MLRIGTDRPGALRPIGARRFRDEALRRLAVLDPIDHRVEPLHAMRAGTAVAVRDAREQVQAAVVASVWVALLDAAPTYQGTGGTCRENSGFSGGLMKAGESVAWDSYPELREVNGRAPGAP